MLGRSNSLFVAATITTLFGTCASADEVKRADVEQGKPVIIANFVAPNPDCSNNPGVQPLPALSQRPLHGMIRLQIGLIDVPASGTCPARRIPFFALFYVSAADFTGADSFQIEIEEGNKKSQISYQITVRASENKQ